MSREGRSEKAVTVLHITPHMGGGVGSVLLNYLAWVGGNADFRHRVLSLEYANKRAWQASETTGFHLEDKMSQAHGVLLHEIEQADIVLIHWWNHPLLYDFLVRETLPPSRIISWSHTSGHHAPYAFSAPALTYPDFCVFTSPLSLEVPETKALPEDRQAVLRVIWSTGGVEQTVALQPRPHEGYAIGYVGTVDYGKLHPHFLEMSNRVDIPDARFIVCGGPREKELQEQLQRQHLSNRFTFTGHVSDITSYLSTFDVFGYPLAPYHYGTCEQSLGESMAAGVPPVVLGNATERTIVEDGVSGVVAQDEDAYVRGLEELHRDPGLRRRLSENAREAASKLYSLERMAHSWEGVFEEAMALPKKRRLWGGHHQGPAVSAAQVYLESLGAHGDAFLRSMNARSDDEKGAADEEITQLYDSSHLWRSDTKGTPKHYLTFFPEDDFLKHWSKLAP
jgi:L-malate glycosyltransferase